MTDDRNIVTNDDKVFCVPCWEDLIGELPYDDPNLAQQGRCNLPCSRCGARRDITAPRTIVLRWENVTEETPLFGPVEILLSKDHPDLPDGLVIIAAAGVVDSVNPPNTEIEFP